jgi:hypothetical protein
MFVYLYFKLIAVGKILRHMRKKMPDYKLYTAFCEFKLCTDVHYINKSRKYNKFCKNYMH